MTDETYNTTQAIVAQKFYCEIKGLHQFAPDDGRCPFCGGQIYDPPSGYSVKYALTNLITGCPLCRYSFVE